MSEGEVLGILLSAYANVKWDHPDLVEAGVVKPEQSEFFDPDNAEGNFGAGEEGKEESLDG
jgi:hypothetical protein